MAFHPNVTPTPRNPPSQSKLPSTAKNATSSGGAPPNSSSSDNLGEEPSNAEQIDKDAINSECERALAALGQRNQTEALNSSKTHAFATKTQLSYTTLEPLYTPESLLK
ncbi:unnamed protein product [Ilex paraguariensis]|uniref:Uncharacterized protein n=1 Tax=Ilex paraguariensis TaxID=185542 RepID=A0ABC8UYI1_9AQUA